MKATYGTGCFLLLHTGERRPAVHRTPAVDGGGRVDGGTTYALEGSIFIAGAAIQWVNERSASRAVPPPWRRSRRGLGLDHGVTLVPAFTGLGAPWWKAEARGAMFGLTRDTACPRLRRPRSIRRLGRPTTSSTPCVGDAPEAFGEAAVLRIDGGMSRSARFPGRLADLTGLPVARARYEETTALGAALFAGVGAGVYASLEEAARARPEADELSPTLPADERAAGRARWREAVGRLTA
jgi:glycerol kinase